MRSAISIHERHRLLLPTRSTESPASGVEWVARKPDARRAYSSGSRVSRRITRGGGKVAPRRSLPAEVRGRQLSIGIPSSSASGSTLGERRWPRVVELSLSARAASRASQNRFSRRRRGSGGLSWIESIWGGPSDRRDRPEGVATWVIRSGAPLPSGDRRPLERARSASVEGRVPLDPSLEPLPERDAWTTPGQTALVSIGPRPARAAALRRADCRSTTQRSESRPDGWTGHGDRPYAAARSSPAPSARIDGVGQRPVLASSKEPEFARANPSTYGSSRCSGSSSGRRSPRGRGRGRGVGASACQSARRPEAREVLAGRRASRGVVLVVPPVGRGGTGRPARGGTPTISSYSSTRVPGDSSQCGEALVELGALAPSASPRRPRRGSAGAGTGTLLPRKRRALRPDQLLAHERHQVLAGRCSRPPSGMSCSDRPRKEHLADDRRSLEHRALVRQRRSRRAASSAGSTGDRDGGQVADARPTRRLRTEQRRRRSASPSISSTNSGLPSAARMIRSRTSVGSSATPSRFPISARHCSFGQRLERHRRRVHLAAAPRRPDLQQLGAGHAYEQDRRRRATSRPRARSGRGRSAPPSGCRRTRATSGRSRARASRNRRIAQNVSSGPRPSRRHR